MLAIAAVALVVIGIVLWWKTKEPPAVASSTPERAATSARSPSPEPSTAVEPAPAPAATPPPAAADAPASCREYAEKMEKCLASDKFPPEVREISKQTYEGMKMGWSAAGGLDGDAKQQAFTSNDQACKAQLDAMKQSGAALCPGVF
jgi:hypothetical protein